MRRFLSAFGTVMKWGTLVSTIGFVACILIQIYARLFLETAPSWTEEAARLFFVIAIGFSAGLALRSGEYVSFDFFYQRMGERWRRRVALAIDLLTVAIFLLFTIYAVEFAVMGWAERSPSLKFPMAIPFAGMFILGLSVLVYAVDRIRGHFVAKRIDP